MKKKNLLLICTLILSLTMMNQLVNAQWQKKPSSFAAPLRSIVELIAVDNNVVWGVAGDAYTPIWEVPPINDFTRSTDGGQHWTAGNISAFPEYNLVGIAPLSATLCYGSLANFNTGAAIIVKTTNGGITWTELLNYDFGQLFGFFADIYFFNANEGLVFGDQSDGYFTIFTTQDGGTTWTRVPEANMPAGLAGEASYVFSTEGVGSTFWTVSTSGRIWKTLDKGLHWAAYETEQYEIEFSNLKMRDSENGLWGVHGELYMTCDGGITWTEVEYAGTWFTNDLAYVPGTASTYVSTGGHDYPGYPENGSLYGIGTSYSVDGGNTWITIDTAVEHLSLAMANAYTGYTGGINTNASNGMFRFNGSALGYSCGNNLTSMCHNGNTICVSHSAIQSHLAHGDVLGSCPQGVFFQHGDSDNLQMQIFPNPVTNSSTIFFSLPQSEQITFRIFDISGRLISTIADHLFDRGENEITWNAYDVRAGIYIVSMQGSDFFQTQRIIIDK